MVLSGIFRSLLASPLAIFVVFLLPWGPGAPAGIIMAQKDGLPPLITIGLYVLSDVVTAIFLDPIIRFLRNRGDQSRVGRRVLASFNRLGGITQIGTGRFGMPFGLFVFTFATDFFTASIVSLGLPMSRIIAWSSIIAGDVTWFLIIFLASIGFASVFSDDRILFVATMLVGFALPPLFRWLFRLRRS